MIAVDKDEIELPSIQCLPDLLSGLWSARMTVYTMNGRRLRGIKPELRSILYKQIHRNQGAKFTECLQKEKHISAIAGAHLSGHDRFDALDVLQGR
jgi:hypothetical protein